jgi:hypothetical protein
MPGSVEDIWKYLTLTRRYFAWFPRELTVEAADAYALDWVWPVRPDLLAGRRPEPRKTMHPPMAIADRTLSALRLDGSGGAD